MRLNKPTTKTNALQIWIAAFAVVFAVSAQDRVLAQTGVAVKTEAAAEKARELLRTAEEALRGLEYERAVSALNKALEGDGLEQQERANGLLNRGLARQNTRDFKGAIKDYSEALTIGTLPGSSKAIAHFNRGLAYNSIAQTTRAVEDLTSAIGINHAFAQAYNSRATLMRMLGRHGAAIRDYQSAVKYRYPKPHLAYYGEALSYLELQQQSLARIALTNALSAYPNFALARTKLEDLNKSLRADTIIVDPVPQGEEKDVARAGVSSPEATKAGETSTGAETRQSTRTAFKVPVPAASAKPVRQAIAVQPAAAEPAEKQKEPVEKPAAKPIQYDGYLVQLMAQRRTGPLNATWSKISKRHASVLGGLNPIIEKVDLGSRGTMYRLKTGPFKSRGRANRLCKALKKRGLDCFSVKAQ